MKKLKKNRVFSFTVIVIAYVIAAFIGLLIGHFMKGPLWVVLLVGDIAATIIIFLFSSLFANASVYDPYWSVLPVIVVFALIFTCKVTALRLLLLVAITVWGVRLTVNWALRFRSLRYEDWRYVRLRKMTGSLFPAVNFAGIHLFPTVVVCLCLLPVTAAFTTDASFSFLSILFFLTALGGVALETYADYHMNLFKKDVADGYASGCCKYGLWKHSRHPNYLGEIVFWWSIYFMVLCAIPKQWGLFAGALLNTLMFLFVSIPMAEARLSGKGGYSRYRDQTHLLIPLPKLRK